MGGTRPRLVSFFDLVAFKCLLVLELLLSILVALQDLIVLDLTELQALIHLTFELLTECAHLVLLLLHKLSFSSEDLFMAVFHIHLTLPLFHLIGALLHLMSFLIVLLLGQIGLDLAEVQ